ncbi:MAG: 2-oxoacid:acceptor oxidoreductase family protein [Candidatus Hydrogenedentes bacterium]|nr:2-oxoacid:acceptor oxidoreductase family protein [Candidatus Hydrogenedentota bacterium]
MGKQNVTNVVFAGLGGQGVLKASDILSDAAFGAGFDVKKSEIHGMSQRGGSVTSDVRYGPEVFSPMVPVGESDFLVALDSTQIAPDLDDLDQDPTTPITRRGFNVALIGVLSAYLDLPEANWREALHGNLPAKTHAVNDEVFAIGRAIGLKRKQS